MSKFKIINNTERQIVSGMGHRFPAKSGVLVTEETRDQILGDAFTQGQILRGNIRVIEAQNHIAQGIAHMDLEKITKKDMISWFEDCEVLRPEHKKMSLEELKSEARALANV